MLSLSIALVFHHFTSLQFAGLKMRNFLVKHFFMSEIDFLVNILFMSKFGCFRSCGGLSLNCG